MKNFYASLFFISSIFSFQSLKSQVIYNAYAKVTTVTNSTLLTVNNVNQASHTFSVGDRVIVMQMQDNVIGTNTTNVSTFGTVGSIANAGRYEVARVAAVNLSSGTPTSIALAIALTNTYNTGTNASVQVITFRRLSAAAFTSTNNITGLAWDGNVGGVIALEVGTTFTLLHNINADGIGFNGGSKNTPNFASTSCEAAFVNAIGNKWAGKGEGIYKNTNTNLAGARGKMINGGGGGTDENSGGGGGSNYSAGGAGGPGYNGGASGCNPNVGGQGGVALSGYITASRVFMGGGGGAGHENNSVGTAGGDGGGIILIKAGTLVTSSSCTALAISANGASVATAGNDGSGGGGGAGSIILQVNSYSVVSTCSLAIRANGGNGGSATDAVTHSGGGGGGQGVVIFSAAQPTSNVSVGTAPGNGGASCSGCTGTVNGSAGSGPGNGGIVTGSSGVLPIELLYFTAEDSDKDDMIALNWATATEKNTNYFELEKSVDGNNWHVITTVKASGNSTTSRHYSFNDYEPENGFSYYRLKTTDNDTRVHVSTIQVVQHSDKGDFVKIFPNPTSDYVEVNWSAKYKNLNYVLSDVSGKEINVKATEVNPHKLQIDLSDINRGIYFMMIKSEGKVISYHKLLVQ